MDPIGKIHVIHALEDGQSKADIARAYGVPLRIISYINQNKESIIKKYAKKYNALKVRYINLDQTLLDWIAVQMKTGINIKEPNLRNKAQELMSNQSNEKFDCIDDWLQDFQKRHNIAKFHPGIDFSVEAQREWNKFADGVDVKDVYIIEMCGLFYTYSFDDFVDQKEPKDKVSLLFIINCLGSDRQQLVVAGQDDVSKGSVRSLPVNYYHGEKSLLNYNIIYDTLKKWDEDLKLQNRIIFLLISEKILHKMKFENIKLVNSSSMVYVTKCTQKIVESFKYHYRKSLLNRKHVHNLNQNSLECLNYLHWMSAAWQAISASFIKMLFFPPEDGSIYFNTDNCSSGTWHIIDSNQLGYDCKDNLLEKYVLCDNHLDFLSGCQDNNEIENINETLLKNESLESSSIQAFQAMKRLYSYLKSENGHNTVMQAARKLEDHLEHGALLELHDVYASINDTE